MKTTILNNKTIKFAIIVSLAAGCSAEDLPAVDSGLDGEEYQEISIGLSGTKTLSDELDHDISCLSAYIFDSNGTKETVITVLKDQITAKVKPGVKNIYVLPNDGYHRVNVESADELMKEVLNLSDNSPSKLIMYGCALNQSVDAQNKTVTISVKPYAAKIVVKKISLDFQSEHLKGKTLYLRSMYLLNVPGSTSVDGTAAPNFWYNRNKNDGSLPDLMYDACNNDELYDGSYIAKNHYFYTFPNYNRNKPSGEDATKWSPRRTMLVIDTEFDGKDNFYSIYIDTDLESNKVYTFENITIHQLGSSVPGEETSTVSANIQLSILNWESGATYNEII